MFRHIYREIVQWKEIFRGGDRISNLSAVKEVKILNFDIVGQKAYIKDGPHRNRIGIVKKKFISKALNFALLKVTLFECDNNKDDLLKIIDEQKEFF